MSSIGTLHFDRVSSSSTEFAYKTDKLEDWLNITHTFNTADQKKLSIPTTSEHDIWSYTREEIDTMPRYKVCDLHRQRADSFRAQFGSSLPNESYYFPLTPNPS